MIDKGPVKYFLSLEVNRDDEKESLSISQKSQIHKLLTEHNMVEYRLMATPLDPKCQIRCDEENCEQVDQSLIGSLMYIALYTRPDILHVNYHKEILIHIEST